MFKHASIKWVLTSIYFDDLVTKKIYIFYASTAPGFKPTWAAKEIKNAIDAQFWSDQKWTQLEDERENVKSECIN